MPRMFLDRRGRELLWTTMSMLAEKGPERSHGFFQHEAAAIRAFGGLCKGKDDVLPSENLARSFYVCLPILFIMCIIIEYHFQSANRNATPVNDFQT